MPKPQTDHLIQLINSLSSTEKRFFRVFVKRNNPSGELLFLLLFNFLDKKKVYDEPLVLKKIPGIKKQQLSNVKAHLYKQLLISLRLQHRNHNQDIELREGLDYARVLYNKGLYRQALEILDKTKNRAIQINEYPIALEVIQFEKLIESQYITRSIETRANELTDESIALSEKIHRSHLFSNLAIKLYGLYLKVGYVRSEKESLFVQNFFQSNLPKVKVEDLDFYEKLYLFQSYSWYHYMTQDLLAYFKYTFRWKELFAETPMMKELAPPLYLKAIHNHLTSLFLLWQHSKFVTVLSELELFEKTYKSNIAATNEMGLLNLYLYIHRINKHYMEGTFTEGLNLVPPLVKLIDQKAYNWDSHREMVFYYKIACLYFGSGDNQNAIHYLNLIINESYFTIREDIQCFSRILCLVAHFELKNDLLLEYQVKSVYRFLRKRDDLHGVQKEILKFIRKIPDMGHDNLRSEFIGLKVNLEKLKSDPMEKRAFLYFDIVSWLESKIEGKTVQEVLREKFLRQEAPFS